MSVEVNVPALGESIVEATVGQWRKHEGESVQAGEALVELETDKVNIEVPAPEAGVLQSIVKQEGETVGIGEVLAVVAEEGAATGAGAPREAPSESQANAQRTSQPATEKPVPAPVAAVTAGGQASAHDGAAPAEHAEVGRVTPLARRIAEEHGVDLSQVQGTGVGGRITHDDVNTYLASQKDGAVAAPSPAPTQAPAQPRPSPAPTAPAAPAAPTSTTPVAPAAPAAPPVRQAAGRGEERIRMSRRRQTIARRLVEVQHTAAMLTTFNEVDMSAILELRKRRRDQFKERYGVGLGFMSFFTKAVIGALKAFPLLNAEIQGDEIVVKRYYDIGIAVSTEEGLVVPVVRDADRLTFAEIERQVASLAEKSRNRTLSLEELQGGTFTITNGGVFGSLLSTPILNGPQVGILGMHKIEERPIALDGQVVIHSMMYLALSYDHRVVDGREAVSFLVRIKELLEDPERLLLEG
jgi:2-oxoglutarate dehydrogenase E2 component (dihydrolipoamide succinyltransferase)